jgi:TonB family protein
MMIRDSSGLMDKSGDVFVEIQVNNGGAVVAARAVYGHPLLQSSSVDAARRWQFAPVEGVAELRTVRLRFTYQTMSKDTPYSELITTFKSPYHVEVRRWSVETQAAPQKTTRRRRR